MNTVRRDVVPQPRLPVWGVALVAAVLAWSAPALSAPERAHLVAPETVARGDAFVAGLSLTRPTDQVSFFWRGGRHAVAAHEVPDSAEGAPIWRAEILLPAPLEETAARLTLGACIGKGCSAPEVARPVRLHDRKRPVQRLTVDRKYVAPPPEEAARIRRDREKVRAALAGHLPGRLWSLPLERPVPGTVSSLFGMKRVFNGQPRGMHRGLDLRGAQGTPIRACADGVVALVDNLYFSGNAVYINHGDGVFSSYLHMSKPLVTPGQRVQRGQVVGLVGATGRVTGPHLHLGLTVQGESVDPQPLLAPVAHDEPRGGVEK